MERYKVNVTDEAKADMRGAARYLAVELRETETAYSLLDRLDVEITSLEELPERYRLIDDAYLASLGIRMTMVGHYLIFYSVDRTSYTVTILRMLHGRRDWINIWQHRTIQRTQLACANVRQTAQKSLAIRQDSLRIFVQPDEIFDGAICVRELCGVAILTKQHTDGKPSST